MNLALTFFPSLRDAQGQRVRTTWPALLERLSVPRVSADKHDVSGLSLATYAKDRRALVNVEQVFAVGLDLDENLDWPALTARFEPVECFLHTTWSSTETSPRARVFLRLSRPVTGDEYRRVYAAVVQRCVDHGLTVDRAASDPSRFWFLPSIQPGGAYSFSIGRGKPVNVDWALAAIPPAATPPPIPFRPRTAYGGASPIDRARAYLQACPYAVSGAGGGTVTFVIAQKLVRGFCLTVDEAFALLANDWNPRCSPPWSDRELRRKVEQAASAGRMAEGEMLARERGR